MQRKEKIVVSDEIKNTNSQLVRKKTYRLSDWECYITDSRFNFSFKRDLADEKKWPGIIQINGWDTGIKFIDNNDFPAREFVNKGQNYREFERHFRGYDLYARFENDEQVQQTLNEITPYLRTPEIAKYIKSFYEDKFILNKKEFKENCMLKKLISYIKENYYLDPEEERTRHRIIVDDENEIFLAHFAEEHPEAYQSACAEALNQTEREVEELVRLVGLQSYSTLREIFQGDEAQEIYKSGFTSLSFLLEEQKNHGSFFGFDRHILGCFAVHAFLDLIGSHKSHLINSKLTFKELLEKNAPKRSSKANFDYATVLFSIKMDILSNWHLTKFVRPDLWQNSNSKQVSNNNNDQPYTTGSKVINTFSPKGKSSNTGFFVIPTSVIKPKEINIPKAFECPITHEIMKDPVLFIIDSNTYERTAITEWLSENRNSPLTRVQMQPEQKIEQVLMSNRALAEAIDEFKAEHPELFTEIKLAM